MRAADEEKYLGYVAGRASALRRTAYLLCGDWHQAEDIVQTAIAKVYVRWPSVSRADNIDAYVRQIVLRVWLDENRRSWARVRRVATVPDAPVTYDGPELRLSLLAALARVAPRQRAVLVLRFWEDQSIQETARLLDCSIGTVKSQTSHGLSALRQLLPEYEHEGTPS